MNKVKSLIATTFLVLTPISASASFPMHGPTPPRPPIYSPPETIDIDPRGNPIEREEEEEYGPMMRSTPAKFYIHNDCERNLKVSVEDDDGKIMLYTFAPGEKGYMGKYLSHVIVNAKTQGRYNKMRWDDKFIDLSGTSEYSYSLTCDEL